MPGTLTNWFPTIVIAGLLGVHWFSIRAEKLDAEKMVEKKIKEHSDSKDAVAKEQEATRAEHDKAVNTKIERQWCVVNLKMDEKKHELVCEKEKLATQVVISNEMQEVRAEIKRFADSVFDAIRELEKAFKTANGVK